MDVKAIVDKSMLLLKSGKVRNNKIKNKAQEHNANVLLLERQKFEAFIVSKNGDTVMSLRGNDNCG